MAAACDRPELVGGPGKFVEVDEVFLRHVRSKNSSQLEPVIVMGLACDGKVVTGAVPNRKRDVLIGNIKRLVHPASTIITDDWGGYRALRSSGFRHIAVNHSIGFFTEGGFSTCSIDSYWGILRRLMRGYHQIAPENLWLYLAEAECRFNCRNSDTAFFETLVRRWPEIPVGRPLAIEKRFDWRLA